MMFTVGYRDKMMKRAHHPLRDSRNAPVPVVLRLKNTENSEGFSLTELMVVLVIIGVLVLLALPKLLPLVTRAKTTEAKLMLKQIYTLEQSYRFEHDRFSNGLGEIGFEQEKLVSEGGQARYKIEISSASDTNFMAQAVSTVDYNGNGIYNVWTVDRTGSIREKIAD